MNFFRVYALTASIFLLLIFVGFFLFQKSEGGASSDGKKEIIKAIHENFVSLKVFVEKNKPEEFETKEKELSYYSLLEDLKWIEKREQNAWNERNLKKEVAIFALTQYVLLLNSALADVNSLDEKYIELAKEVYNRKEYDTEIAKEFLQEYELDSEESYKEVEREIREYAEYLKKKIDAFLSEGKKEKAIIEARKLYAMRKE